MNDETPHDTGEPAHPGPRHIGHAIMQRETPMIRQPPDLAAKRQSSANAIGPFLATGMVTSPASEGCWSTNRVN